VAIRTKSAIISKVVIIPKVVRGTGRVVIAPLDRERVEEWSDGSRTDGRAAGATITRGLYLGKWATVADAEETGVMPAWQECDRVAGVR